LAKEDVAFYWYRFQVVKGNIKHHDDSSYRITVVMCVVKRDAKTLLVAQMVKNLYFKMLC